MSENQANLEDLPFFDEEMPDADEQQRPAEPNQNVVAVAQNPPTCEARNPPPQGTGRQVPTNGPPRMALTAAIAIPFPFHYHDQNVGNFHGRRYSKPVVVPRRPAGSGQDQADDAAGNTPPNNDNNEYFPCNCNRGHLASPKHKIPKRDNKPKDGDDAKN